MSFVYTQSRFHKSMENKLRFSSQYPINQSSQFKLFNFCYCQNIQIDAPTSDFIELYTNEIAMLKRKVQALVKQNEILSESVNT